MSLKYALLQWNSTATEFLREKFCLWAGNGSCVEDIWKSYKDIIFEGIKLYVPHKILGINPDPEYYNKEVKRLKVKVRKMYNKRKLGSLTNGN